MSSEQDSVSQDTSQCEMYDPLGLADFQAGDSGTAYPSHDDSFVDDPALLQLMQSPSVQPPLDVLPSVFPSGRFVEDGVAGQLASGEPLYSAANVVTSPASSPQASSEYTTLQPVVIDQALDISVQQVQLSSVVQPLGHISDYSQQQSVPTEAALDTAQVDAMVSQWLEYVQATQSNQQFDLMQPAMMDQALDIDVQSEEFDWMAHGVASTLDGLSQQQITATGAPLDLKDTEFLSPGSDSVYAELQPVVHHQTVDNSAQAAQPDLLAQSVAASFGPTLQEEAMPTQAQLNPLETVNTTPTIHSVHILQLLPMPHSTPHSTARTIGSSSRFRYILPRPASYVPPNIPTQARDDHFQCDFGNCKATFKQRRSLTAHVKSKHLKLKSFQCIWPGCDKLFSTCASVCVHIRVIHLKMPKRKSIQVRKGLVVDKGLDIKQFYKKLL